MHLLVLSAFRPGEGAGREHVPPASQCTFWCSVLSDRSDSPRSTPRPSRLNAPFGAQCFPTRKQHSPQNTGAPVSMHLLVLSAFRLKAIEEWLAAFESQCTFWCSVLSDLDGDVSAWCDESQCTFWCSVLSDDEKPMASQVPVPSRLNAPFGAQCFPTSKVTVVLVIFPLSQCTFWCSVLSDRYVRHVKRHGLIRSQCTFWCSVLSDVCAGYVE